MGDEVINIGINHPAYKVSKRELLDWLNSVLNCSFSNCDKDVGDGAAYAQVFHAINKKSVNVSQIKWGAKSEYEYTINYNIVQKAMQKIHINKLIPVEALMKGKPLDNIEFCQWLKHYYSNVAVVEGYDGYAEREGSKPGVGKKFKKWSPSDGAAAPAPAAKKSAVAKKPMASNQATASRTAASGAASAEAMAQIKTLEAEVATHKHEISEMNLNVDALTKERDFYFGKLRDVEIMLQEKEGDESLGEETTKLMEQIKEILYATDNAEDGVEGEEDF